MLLDLLRQLCERNDLQGIRYSREFDRIEISIDGKHWMAWNDCT